MRHGRVWLTIVAGLACLLFNANQPQSLWAQSTATPTPVADKRIVFESSRDNATHIWTMQVDGSAQHRLTTTTKLDNLDPAWSPNGRQIVFVRRGQDGSPQLWLMDADGTHQRLLLDLQLAHTPFSPSPVWSPDGKQIAFFKVTDIHGSSLIESEIELVNLDSRTTQPLVTQQAMEGIEPGQRFFPTVLNWSWDSQRLVFEQAPWGTRGYTIYVVNRDGSRLRKVSDGGGHGGPSWSPNGTTILIGDAETEKIVVMDVAGTRRTLSGLDDRDRDPAWSPDGEFIAFFSGQNLFVMSPNGKGRQQLTSDIPVFDQVKWSPDAKRIGFIAEYNDHEQIFAVDVDGNHLQRLSDGTGDDLFFEWQP